MPIDHSSDIQDENDNRHQFRVCRISIDHIYLLINNNQVKIEDRYNHLKGGRLVSIFVSFSNMNQLEKKRVS